MRNTLPRRLKRTAGPADGGPVGSDVANDVVMGGKALVPLRPDAAVGAEAIAPAAPDVEPASPPHEAPAANVLPVVDFILPEDAMRLSAASLSLARSLRRAAGRVPRSAVGGEPAPSPVAFPASGPASPAASLASVSSRNGDDVAGTAVAVTRTMHSAPLRPPPPPRGRRRNDRVT